jgi:hypothetical protein
MVIDLTRRPVFINTDICQNSVVIRTASGAGVDGRLRRKLEPGERLKGRGETRGGKDATEVAIGALRVGPKRTIMECRLPIDHVLRRGPKDPIPNPFEVATVVRDAFTDTMGAWRVQILVEHTSNKNGDLWLITLRDEGLKTDLFTATAKELDTTDGHLSIPGVKSNEDRLPLERMRGEGVEGPLSVWDRLRRIEYNPNPSMADEDDDSLT